MSVASVSALRLGPRCLVFLLLAAVGALAQPGAEVAWTAADPVAATPVIDPLAPLENLSPGTVRVENGLYRIEFSTLGAVPVSWRLSQHRDLPPPPKLAAAFAHTAQREEKAALASLAAHMRARDVAEQELRAALARARETGDHAAARTAQRELDFLLGVDLIPRDVGADRWFGALRFQDVWYDSATVYHATTDHVLVSGQPTSISFVARLRSATVAKTYTFYPDTYRCELAVRVQAEPTSPLAGVQRFELFWGPGINQHYGRISQPPKVRLHIDKSARQLLPPAILKAQERGKDVVSGALDWFALEDQYFAAVVIPHGRLDRTRVRVHEISPEILLPVCSAQAALPVTAAGLDSVERFTLYIGPKEHDKLVALGNQTTDMLFYGWTGGISLFMLSILHFFYGLTGNYGVAIICLTLVVRLLLFPIAQRQFRVMKESAAKMEKIKPQLDALKEKYQDDQRKLSEEQMKLMHQHKIMQAQMKGCLPMLLQLPIFIALFYTLQLAIELRGAPFFGWIVDLSSQDAAFYIPMLIPLPFVGPVLAFNVLPIINAAITWYQMKKTTSTATMDPAQQMMINIMPVFMLLLLWPWPSGLFVYWTCSSLFGFAQQYYINKTYKPLEQSHDEHAREQPKPPSRAPRKASGAAPAGKKSGGKAEATLTERLGLNGKLEQLKQWVEEKSQHPGESSRPARPKNKSRDRGV